MWIAYLYQYYLMWEKKQKCYRQLQNGDINRSTDRSLHGLISHSDTQGKLLTTSKDVLKMRGTCQPWPPSTSSVIKMNNLAPINFINSMQPLIHLVLTPFLKYRWVIYYIYIYIYMQVYQPNYISCIIQYNVSLIVVQA